MKILLIAILLFTICSPAYAKVYLSTGEELVTLKTTDGYMAFTNQEALNIQELKNHTVIVKLIEDNKLYIAAGIAIDKRHILTVNHITSNNGRNFYFANDESTPYWVTIIKQDVEHDIALMEIDKSAPDLIGTMVFNNASLNDIVYTIGHPDAGHHSLTTGRVDGLRGELDMRIHGGNSGGLVMNQKGELVGMIFEKAELIGNIAYMVTNQEIQNFLK